jgi:large subunit ribosomal protein L9
MKVVLNADMGRLGHKGDIVEVAPGYARNYLLPTNRAILATKGSLKQAESMQRARALRDQRDKAAFTALATRIASSPLKVTAKAGAEGHLFGSVTTSDIAALLAMAIGEDVDRRKIGLSEPIKSVGTHDFTVHLHSDVVAAGQVEVVAEGTPNIL